MVGVMEVGVDVWLVFVWLLEFCGEFYVECMWFVEEVGQVVEVDCIDYMYLVGQVVIVYGNVVLVVILVVVQVQVVFQ